MKTDLSLKVGRLPVSVQDVFSLVADYFSFKEASFYLEHFQLAGTEAQWASFHTDFPRKRKPFVPDSLPHSYIIKITAQRIPLQAKSSKPNADEYTDQVVGKIIVSPVQSDSHIEIERWKLDDLYLNALFNDLSQHLREIAGRNTLPDQEQQPRPKSKANNTPSIADYSKCIEDFVPPSKEVGKKYFQGYNRATAKRIASAIIEAHIAAQSDKGFATKYGTGLIAKKASLTISTVSRYLRVFRAARITEICGVKLPN